MDIALSCTAIKIRRPRRRLRTGAILRQQQAPASQTVSFLVTNQAAVPMAIFGVF